MITDQYFYPEKSSVNIQMIKPFVLSNVDEDIISACKTYNQRLAEKIGEATLVTASDPSVNEAEASPTTSSSTTNLPNSISVPFSFPLDFSALLYQSKSLLTIRVPQTAIHVATPTQRELAAKYTCSTSTDEGGPALASEIPTIQVDVITLHRLLKPPSFEDEGNVGYTMANMLWEANWGMLVGALFPLTVGGKKEAAEGMAEEGLALRKSLLWQAFLSVSGWKALRYDSHITDRFHYSYSAVLNFFGWRLHNEETGEVDRHSAWRDRYQELAPQGSKEEESLQGANSPYPHLTVVIQALLELRLFPFAAKLLLFLLEEFRCSRLRALVDGMQLPESVLRFVCHCSLQQPLPSGEVVSQTGNVHHVSLFDNIWLPMLQGYNSEVGNCYDGNSDMARIIKRRSALDASDSE